MGFAALLALAALLVAVRADLSIPRYNLAAAAANNYIIFAGGTYARPLSSARLACAFLRQSFVIAPSPSFSLTAPHSDGTNFYNAIDLYDTIISAWSSSPAVGNLSAGVANLVGGNLPAGFLFVGGRYASVATELIPPTQRVAVTA